MRKRIALVCMLVVLSSFVMSPAPAAAQTDVPLCGIMHTDKDGNIVCDDGPNGIMHTDGDSEVEQPTASFYVTIVVLDVLLALRSAV